MYTILSIAWLALGAIPFIRSLRRVSGDDSNRRRRRIIRGIVIFAIFVALLVLASIAISIFTEVLWFSSLGFSERYWLELTAKVGLFLAFGLLGFAALFAVMRWAATDAHPLVRRWLPPAGATIGALMLGARATAWWELVLRWIYQAPSEVVDPIFGRSVGYYLFTLPLYRQLVGWGYFLLFLAVLALGAVFLIGFGNATSGGQAGNGSSPSARGGSRDVQIRRILSHSWRLRRVVLAVAAFAFLLLAWSNVLKIFELLYARDGIVTGPGWVDVNVRRYAYALMAAVHLILAILAIASAASERVLRRVLALRRAPLDAGGSGERSVGGNASDSGDGSGTRLVPTGRSAILPGAVIALSILATGIAPWAVQALVVNPNEITLEEPYIAHNIEFTRRAFGLTDQRITERDYSVGREITREVVAANRDTLSNVRLWDPTALLSNLQEQQEIRLYYQFEDVDIDRYTIDGEYTQVMLSLRELEKSQLPESAQTWVSRHLKYTHGYGLVMLSVHDFLSQGRPDLFIRNIPPEVEFEQLELTRPEIYYGERTTDHVYVNTTQREFNYPSGTENVYTDYEGEGGVRIGGLLRRLVFGARFDGEKQLFSSYIEPRSRILFDRAVRPRAAKAAPFLTFDDDPYPVVTDDGEIVFIVDAYTISGAYPYSEPYQGRRDRYAGANYLRNSVKAVVDAYDGSVTYYVIEPDDIMVRTYRNMFPALFRPIEEMPADLRRHIRYPVDFLTVQAEMYAIYHMTDVQTFYQREDEWDFATERYRESAQPVEPYYVLVNFPEDGGSEFVLMIPFTPRNKNVMNAWIAGHSDGERYGEVTVFTFPKGVEVLGPRQIEARVDQNSEMSQTLSLWDQEGSQVIRGNMLTIPLFLGEELFMLFAEPVFLQAESAQLPEIKRIVLSDQTQVVWAEQFDASLEALVGAGAAGRPAVAAAPAGATVSPALRELALSAVDSFESYRRRLQAGEFERAGVSLAELASAMARMSGELTGGESESAQ